MKETHLNFTDFAKDLTQAIQFSPKISRGPRVSLKSLPTSYLKWLTVAFLQTPIVLIAHSMGGLVIKEVGHSCTLVQTAAKR
jgi:hypothetical protein